MAANADEQTPLLASPAADSGSGSGSDSSTAAAESLTRITSKDASTGSSWKKRWLALSPANRVLLAGFIVSLSFGFTQVSIFYVFHLMECDIYYDNHPPYTDTGDRCSRNEIAAGTAAQFSILGISTTFFGTINLFVTGHQVKAWGPRAALVLQTSIPAIRVATQIIGVLAGGQAGIWIIQLTQIITVFGGPAGYILVVNTIAGEVVPPIERTELFGKLQGCVMLGSATGFLLGGLVGDAFGIVRPFQTAFFFFCFSSIYARLAMPYISPDTLVDKHSAQRGGGLAAFFQPLKVMLPQKIRRLGGRITNHYGVFFLCFGNFLGVLATGYAPTLLQMYATAVFDFDQAKNGWLMSGNNFMRAIFLIFVFPRIISAGRRWFVSHSRTSAAASAAAASTGSSTTAADSASLSGASSTMDVEVLPTDPELFDVSTTMQADEEPIITAEPDADEKEAYAFDLFFLRWSLLVDGILTAGAALATQGWHMYLVTLLLPFGSGSAPAAKGVITSMCPSSQRTDALNAITLVENFGRLATMGFFGFVFSALAQLGRADLTFYCNGAVAVVGMIVLLFSHFPPSDSVLAEDDEIDEAAPLISSS